MAETKVRYGKHAQEGLETEDIVPAADRPEEERTEPIPTPQYGPQKAGGVYSELRALEIQREQSRNDPPGSVVSMPPTEHDEGGT